MRTRTIVTTGALLGWLALGLQYVHAQDAKPADPHGWISTETIKMRFGDFEFKNGYPSL